jgi:hypothetical protein
VNAVAPSIMDTPSNRRDMPKANFDAWPKVEEVATTILFLASPENKVTRWAATKPQFKAAGAGRCKDGRGPSRFSLSRLPRLEHCVV